MSLVTRYVPLVAFAFIVFAPNYASACTCGGMSVRSAKRSADIVFAGRVEEITRIDSQDAREPRLIVRFSVARVWKGPVTSTFEMHTNYELSSCEGFFKELLQPGRTLLVYGYGRPASNWKNGQLGGAPNAHSFTTSGDDGSAPLRKDLIDALPDEQLAYTTNICTRTMPIEYAVEDFDRLGKPRELGELYAKPDRALVEAEMKRMAAMMPKPNGLPEECAELANEKEWHRLKTPPPEAKELVALLESGSSYTRIPNPRLTRYRDDWVARADGAFGLCRTSVKPLIVCGESRVTFVRDGEQAPAWKINEGMVSTYCKE